MGYESLKKLLLVLLIVIGCDKSSPVSNTQNIDTIYYEYFIQFKVNDTLKVFNGGMTEYEYNSTTKVWHKVTIDNPYIKGSVHSRGASIEVGATSLLDSSTVNIYYSLPTDPKIWSASITITNKDSLGFDKYGILNTQSGTYHSSRYRINNYNATIGMPFIDSTTYGNTIVFEDSIPGFVLVYDYIYNHLFYTDVIRDLYYRVKKISEN